MRKLVRNHEKNDFYDSDDEKDPYASSVSSTVTILIGMNSFIY
jgi:hypothetical protein